MDYSCGKSVQFCALLASEYTMSIEFIDKSKPVRFGWEAFFKYVDPFTGRVYYGQEGTIIRIKKTHVISTYNLVNINPGAEVNECRECPHPHPSKSHHRMLSNSSLFSPDPISKNKNEDKKKRPPLLFPFGLRNEIWFGGENNNSTKEVCDGTDETDSRMASIIIYPRYFIINSDRTEIIHKGSICQSLPKGRNIEACEEVLPYDGKFLFRVAGFEVNERKESESDVNWDFCGISGNLGEELEFEMVNGHCQAGEKRSAKDYAKGFQSFSTWSGILVIESASSSYSSVEDKEADSKILERALSGVLRNGMVRINSLELSGNELKVSFTCLFILERFGYEGLYPDEIEKANKEIYSMMTEAMSSGALSVSLQDSISLNPSSVSSFMSHMKLITMDTFELQSLTHKVISSSKSSSTSSGSISDSSDLTERSDEDTRIKIKEGNQNLLNGFSSLGVTSPIVFISLIVLIILVTRQFAFIPAPDNLRGESSHSLISTSVA